MTESNKEPSSIPTRSFRILMVAPTSFFADYGCHVRILEEIQILQKLGHKVTVVTYHNGNDVPGIDIRRTLPIPWRQNYEVGSSRHKIAFDALLGWKTLTMLMGERFDVIHAHLHEGALIGAILGKLFDIPVVFDFQGSLTAEMVDHRFLKETSFFYKPLLRLETWLDRSVQQILTSSSHAEKLLIDQFGCDADRVNRLPDSVNGDVFRPADTYSPGELAELRHSLGIPADRRLLVYLGLLAEHQGTTHLLQAVQRIVQKRQDVHLLLMGFPSVDLYQAQAYELGISNFVTMTGRIPYQEAPKYLALGDVAAAPKLSATEGAGKLLNYMAVGLPTVAFDTPVAREYLGHDGFLARSGDVDHLAEKLLGALFPEESGINIANIGQQLRQRAIQCFSWDAAGRQILSVYEVLTSQQLSSVVPDATKRRQSVFPQL